MKITQEEERQEFESERQNLNAHIRGQQLDIKRLEAEVNALRVRLESAKRVIAATLHPVQYVVNGVPMSPQEYRERFGGRDETKTVEFEAYVFPVHGGKSGRELRAGNINDADELKVFADEKVRIRVWRRE